MNTGVYLLSSFFGGAVGGAIGAAASQDSDHPVIKGAVVAGLINAAVSAVFIAGASAEKQIAAQPGVSSAGTLQAEWGIR